VKKLSTTLFAILLFSALIILLFFFSGNTLQAQKKPENAKGEQYADCLTAFKKEHHKFCELTDTVVAYAFLKEISLQLDDTRIKSERRKKSLIITIFIALLLIGGDMVRYFVFRKKSLPSMLMLKLQECAQEMQKLFSEPIINEKQEKLPDEVDLLIIKDIEQLMLAEKLYREHSLTVNCLALKLGAKRYYVSEAINHCLKKSFNTYVNEYRIKEATQLLLIKDPNTLTMDKIATEVGFNNYHNFYRVFKKTTGLSPIEYRKKHP